MSRKTDAPSQQWYPFIWPKHNNLSVCMAVKTCQLTFHLWKREYWSQREYISRCRYESMLTVGPPCKNFFNNAGCWWRTRRTYIDSRQRLERTWVRMRRETRSRISFSMLKCGVYLSLWSSFSIFTGRKFKEMRRLTSFLRDGVLWKWGSQLSGFIANSLESHAEGNTRLGRVTASLNKVGSCSIWSKSRHRVGLLWGIAVRGDPLKSILDPCYCHCCDSMRRGDGLVAVVVVVVDQWRKEIINRNQNTLRRVLCLLRGLPL